MSLLHPTEAQALHPDAWQRIESDMDEMKQGTTSVLVPVVAEVLNEEGEQVLHVVALTDFIAEGDVGYPATMSFKTSLAPF